MNLRIDEVVMYDEYSDDPDAENSIVHASRSVPVYIHQDEQELTVLSSIPKQGDKIFGYLHSFDDPEYEEDRRLVVVKKDR